MMADTLRRARVTTALVSLLTAWAALSYAQRDRAGEILAQAREAIGGEARLRAIHSLSLKAAATLVGGVEVLTTNPDGSHSTTRYESHDEVEIDVLLPDRFLLTRRAGGSSRFFGITGDRPIVTRESYPPQILADPRLVADLARRQHREFQRYTIALLLMPPERYGVEFTDGGEAATDGGPADVLDAKGANDFAVRLFFHKLTHRLILMTVQEPLPFSAGTPTSREASAPSGDKDQPLFRSLQGPVAVPATLQMRLSDYRNVDGVALPHRIVTYASRVDEWRVTRLQVNPALKVKLFDK